jgi:hypothetical protein
MMKYVLLGAAAVAGLGYYATRTESGQAKARSVVDALPSINVRRLARRRTR